MFDITIKGRVARKKDLKEYIERVMHHYFGNRLRRVIDLDIQMYTEIDEGSIAGYCYGDKDAVQIELARNWSKSPRKNRVKRPFTYDELVLNLTHELVHAKQFIRGEISTKHDKWKRSEYTYNCARVAYHNQPWEIEAYKSEDMLKSLYWDKVWETAELEDDE